MGNNRNQNTDPSIDPDNQSPAADENAEAGKPLENITPPAPPEELATERAKSNELTSEQKSTLKRLQDRPKKSILIPDDPLNPHDLVVPISVNGVTFAIPRGKRFEVPDVIADIWEDSYAKTQAANRRIKMQRPEDITITS